MREKKKRPLGPRRNWIGSPDPSRHLNPAIAAPHRLVLACDHLSSPSLASAVLPQINQHDHQARTNNAHTKCSNPVCTSSDPVSNSTQVERFAFSSADQRELSFSLPCTVYVFHISGNPRNRYRGFPSGFRPVPHTVKLLPILISPPSSSSCGFTSGGRMLYR